MLSHDSAEEGPASVNISGGQGIQAGTHNTQHNYWERKQPPEPAVLATLNPHRAVARLQQLSDEELEDFFARASPPDIAEVLATFLEVDEAKVVATLAHVNHRHVRELIKAAPAAEFLVELPEAEQEITRRARALGWTAAGPLELVSGGYARKYNSGHVFWSSETGTRTTVGEIDDYWMSSGHYWWGVPVGDQEAAPSSPYGTEGYQQQFQAGTAFSSPEHGVHLVANSSVHADEGGSGGWLGFPTGERLDSTDFRRVEHFEGGAIYSYSNDGSRVTFAVPSGVMRALESREEFRPVTRELYTESSSGQSRYVQRFEFAEWGGETAVYYSWGGYDAVAVAVAIWPYYDRLGAEKSWLGFPVAAVDPARVVSGVQEFESGTVFWRLGTSTIAVGAWLTDQDRNRLGFPVSEEEPAGEDGHGRLQFFDRGVVTLRDGKREIWLRPDSTRDLR